MAASIFSKRLDLARAEAGEQSRGQGGHRHRLINGFDQRPAAFARVPERKPRRPSRFGLTLRVPAVSRAARSE